MSEIPNPQPQQPQLPIAPDFGGTSLADFFTQLMMPLAEFLSSRIETLEAKVDYQAREISKLRGEFVMSLADRPPAFEYGSVPVPPEPIVPPPIVEGLTQLQEAFKVTPQELATKAPDLQDSRLNNLNDAVKHWHAVQAGLLDLGVPQTLIEAWVNAAKGFNTDAITFCEQRLLALRLASCNCRAGEKCLFCNVREDLDYHANWLKAFAAQKAAAQQAHKARETQLLPELPVAELQGLIDAQPAPPPPPPGMAAPVAPPMPQPVAQPAPVAQPVAQPAAVPPPTSFVPAHLRPENQNLPPGFRAYSAADNPNHFEVLTPDGLPR